MSPKISVAGITADGAPRWVVAVAVLAVVGISALGSYWTIVRRPGDQLVTLQQANDALRADMAEYGRHIGETPERTATLIDDARGRLTVMQYGDGCTLLARTSPRGTRSKLIVDLARDPDAAPHAWLRDLEPTVEAAGRCVAQHPQAPAEQRVRLDGCWWRVIRTWPDGCQQVQEFDACHGAWTQARWTQCVH